MSSAAPRHCSTEGPGSGASIGGVVKPAAKRDSNQLTKLKIWSHTGEGERSTRLRDPQSRRLRAERILDSGEADMGIARAVGGGDSAFLPGHAPFVGALEIATVTLRTAGGDQRVRGSGGYVGSDGIPRLNVLDLQRQIRTLPKPVGLLARDDRRAREVLDSCRVASLHVPEEIAVLGVNDDELICEMANPPLSSIVIHNQDRSIWHYEFLNDKFPFPTARFGQRVTG